MHFRLVTLKSPFFTLTAGNLTLLKELEQCSQLWNRMLPESKEVYDVGCFLLHSGNFKVQEHTLYFGLLQLTASLETSLTQQGLKSSSCMSTPHCHLEDEKAIF